MWCSDAAATVAQVIYNKHTKDVFQAAISRGNPNLVTPVELDFSLPRNIALAQQCQVLLNWESSYKTLSRQAHTPISMSPALQLLSCAEAWLAQHCLIIISARYYAHLVVELSC